MNKYFPPNTIKQQTSKFFSLFQNGCHSNRSIFLIPLTNFNFACLTVLYQSGLIESFSIKNSGFLAVKPRRVFNRLLIRRLMVSPNLRNSKKHCSQKYEKFGPLGFFYYKGSVFLRPLKPHNSYSLLDRQNLLLGTVLF